MHRKKPASLPLNKKPNEGTLFRKSTLTEQLGTGDRKDRDFRFNIGPLCEAMDRGVAFLDPEMDTDPAKILGLERLLTRYHHVTLLIPAHGEYIRFVESFMESAYMQCGEHLARHLSFEIDPKTEPQTISVDEARAALEDEVTKAHLRLKNELRHRLGIPNPHDALVIGYIENTLTPKQKALFAERYLNNDLQEAGIGKRLR